MSADSDNWLSCPECEKRLKSKNLTRHLQRVHKLNASEAKSTKEELEKADIKGRRSVNKKSVYTLGIAIILVLSIFSVFFVVTPDDGDENNGNGKPPADPNRVEFTTEDGFKLVGSFFPAKDGVITKPEYDRPILICVHGMNEKRAVWKNNGLVDDALDWGFNVLTYDIRGHGESVYKNGKKFEFSDFTSEDILNMPLDVRAAIKFIISNYATNGRIAVIGASIGANSALSMAWNEPSIRSLVLLSPSLNYQGITTYDPVYDYRQRALFICAGSNEYEITDDCEDLAARAAQADSDFGDDRELKLEFYSHTNPSEFLHGTNLFKVEQFKLDLENWLKDTMINPTG